VMGLFRTALRVTQGLGVALGGVVATAIGSATGTVALAGALGVLAATAVAVAWARQRVRPGAVKVAADVG